MNRAIAFTLACITLVLGYIFGKGETNDLIASRCQSAGFYAAGQTVVACRPVQPAAAPVHGPDRSKT